MSEPNSAPRPTGQPPDPVQTAAAFQKLVEVVARLRAPDGCPWDREQTLKSIRPFTLEETYEVLEAIDADDDPALVEELGDLLLQVILYAQIAADEGRFDLVPILEGIAAKLIRRHPHVFGDEQAETAAQVITHWERIKAQEKKRESLLDGIPAALPALARATRLASKAGRVGFDWPDRTHLFIKLREEMEELEAELRLATDPSAEDSPELQQRIADEIGDVLFTVANLARHWGVNPEDALRGTNQKFARRFGQIEQALRATGEPIETAGLARLEELYQQVKEQERGA